MGGGWAGGKTTLGAARRRPPNPAPPATREGASAPPPGGALRRRPIRITQQRIPGVKGACYPPEVNRNERRETPERAKGRAGKLLLQVLQLTLQGCSRALYAIGAQSESPESTEPRNMCRGPEKSASLGGKWRTSSSGPKASTTGPCAGLSPRASRPASTTRIATAALSSAPRSVSPARGRAAPGVTSLELQFTVRGVASALHPLGVLNDRTREHRLNGQKWRSLRPGGARRQSQFALPLKGVSLGVPQGALNSMLICCWSLTGVIS